MKISVVFPIHNEFENLKILLAEWSNGFKKIQDLLMNLF
jgi:hypothetical protein